MKRAENQSVTWLNRLHRCSTRPVAEQRERTIFASIFGHRRHVVKDVALMESRVVLRQTAARTQAIGKLRVDGPAGPQAGLGGLIPADGRWDFPGERLPWKAAV